MKVYYLVPDSERPSWGMGIIYDHVNMLRNAGFESRVIKKTKLNVPAWLPFQVPVSDYNYLKKEIRDEDILVVPEAMMDFRGLKKMQCRKILFIQAPGYIFESMPEKEDHISLGFEHVIIIMPHMAEIVKKHIHLPFTMINPYVADYFFSDHFSSDRIRQVLIYPKFHQIDYSIVHYLVDRHIKNRNRYWVRNLVTRENWKLKELKNFTHREVAEEMKKSALMISLNTFEALNTSVVEAMASGCIPFCYEGVGPRDFLENGKNAMVFGNNEAYTLSEAVCDWIDHFEERGEEHKRLQENGFKTASYYNRATTEKQLIEFFKGYV